MNVGQKVPSPSTLTHQPQRLAPRSKTGCWTCRRRKVKCTEERPICAQCSRLNQTCDYEVKYNFKDANATVVPKKGDFRGNPAWDPRTHKSRPSPSLSSLDDTADFATLPTEEDRERKAGFHEPGRFYVVANQDSFASLPEYRQASTRRSPSTAEPQSASSYHSSGDWNPSRRKRYVGSESDVSTAGKDTIFIDRFEMPSEKPSEKQNQPYTTAPLAVRTKASPDSQLSHQQYQMSPQYLRPPITNYASQRQSHEVTPLDTTGISYYRPTTSSPQGYAITSQQPRTDYQPSASQHQDPHSSQYSTAPQFSHMSHHPEPHEDTTPFYRLLPQPTLPMFSTGYSLPTSSSSQYQPSNTSSQYQPPTSSTAYSQHPPQSLYGIHTQSLQPPQQPQTTYTTLQQQQQQPNPSIPPIYSHTSPSAGIPSYISRSQSYSNPQTQTQPQSQQVSPHTYVHSPIYNQPYTQPYAETPLSATSATTTYSYTSATPAQSGGQGYGYYTGTGTQHSDGGGVGTGSGSTGYREANVGEGASGAGGRYAGIGAGHGDYKRR